ncbi:MAG: NAD-dependent epimerase/dehydratase family protein [Nitrospirota bacterium]
MKVLVTGGAGFIGSHLVDRLIEENYAVVVVDDLSTGKRKQVNREATFYKADILSSRLERIFRKERPEVVSHHAAQINVRRSLKDPIFDAQVNILGLLNVLQQSVRYGVRRVTLASSGGAIYGEQQTFPATEEHAAHPLSPYGVSKLADEHFLYYFRQSAGLQTASLRYSNVYGPRQDPFGEAGVVSIFIQKLLRGETPLINGTGRQTRDFIFVEDVVEANMAVLHSGVEGVYNVGTGRETSVNELCAELKQLIGADVREQHGPEIPGEVLRSCLDPTRLQKATDWTPRVPLTEGLKRTVEHFRQCLG